MPLFCYTGGTAEQGLRWGAGRGGAPGPGRQNIRGSKTGHTMNLVNEKYWGSDLTHFKLWNQTKGNLIIDCDLVSS